jgi:quinolinate synthase
MSSIGEQIDAIRDELGKRLLILGHHYQRSSVVAHADESGDSLELARKAAAYGEAEKIVFCGVRFMAESADMLSGANQTVYMPDTLAGCPMARMADVGEADAAWERLTGVGEEWVPVVYVNSTAEIKAFCGRHGGSACTSSNAANVFEWAFEQRKKILFLPDEHLGVNTAHDLGLPDESVLCYDPGEEGGGLSDEQVANSRVVVWKGFCIVHVSFTVDHVESVREQIPDAKIIVHPEAPKEVVRIVDAHGSTSQIINYVHEAPEGSTIVIGTELNLVDRLGERYRGVKTVKALSPSVCANMSKTNERNLLQILQNWPQDHEVHVPEDVAVDARKCLETMLGL